MLRMWDVCDVGRLGCVMFGLWHMGCLAACGMLIYKMGASIVPSQPTINDCLRPVVKN